ncbi:MAG: sulfur carrier protein ThiS [Rikenellaceae bacterium]|jgi:sulfur carrier protein|nr:sulfur carrier protein ThiS [Rikenellaceae bacterium]
MKIYVNDEIIVTQAENLQQLVTELSLDTRGMALAIGARVVPRGAWEQTPLEEDVRITLIRATRGG